MHIENDFFSITTLRYLKKYQKERHIKQIYRFGVA